MTSADGPRGRRIALFGGSFNPPHIGHVLSVAFVLSSIEVDAVLVAPTYQHAFGKSLASWEQRLEMTQAAMAPFGDRVMISEIERELGGESRTIRVVEALLAREPGVSIVLVVGTDILLEIDRWMESERLLSLVELAVLDRGGYPSSDPRVIGPRVPEVSSSALRRALAKRDLALCRTLMPNRVLAFIEDQGLYREAPDDRAVDVAGRVRILGAGRAGLAVGAALIRVGWDVVSVWSRSAERARSTSEELALVGESGDLSDASLDADVLIVAVVDDAIGEVAERVATRLDPQTVVLHTSGSLGVETLLDAGIGAEVAGSLHPLIALPETAAGRAVAAASLYDAFIAVEGGARARAVAWAMAESVGARVATVGEGGKTAYHAGAVIVSNYLATLFGQGVRLLGTAGIEASLARKMLYRLATSALDNLVTRSAAAALTGPIRRGDATTVSRHLALLGGERELSDIDGVYRALVEPTVALAVEAGLSQEAAEALFSLVRGRHDCL